MKHTLEERQAWAARRRRSTEEVVAVCAANPAIQPYARIVGAWVWVEFPDKPGRAILAWLRFEGFHWSSNRQAWQHPCGVFRPRMRAGDPRDCYGSTPLNNEQQVFDDEAMERAQGIA